MMEFEVAQDAVEDDQQRNQWQQIEQQVVESLHGVAQYGGSTYRIMRSNKSKSSMV